MNACVDTCVCKRACIQKVSQCNYLIVGVGSRGPAGHEAGMEGSRPQTARAPQTTRAQGGPPYVLNE